MKYTKQSWYQLPLIVSALLLLGNTFPGWSFAPTSKARVSAEIKAKTTVNNSNFLKAWKRTRSPRWFGFGARRGTCEILNGEIVPIVPPDTDAKEISFWYSASDKPKITVYIPNTKPEVQNSEFDHKAEFSLKADTGKTDGAGNPIFVNIYSAKVSLPEQAGVVTLDFSNSSKFPTLEANTAYQWDLKVLCSYTNQASNPSVSSGIQRVDSRDIETEIAQAQPMQRPEIYKNDSIWYESVSSLTDLIQANPTDQALQQQWQSVMTDVAHPELAQAPIAGSATIISELSEQ